MLNDDAEGETKSGRSVSRVGSGAKQALMGEEATDIVIGALKKVRVSNV